MVYRPTRTQMVAFGQQIGNWGKSPPRNSIALIERALLEDFDIIELDVRVSQDGIAVLAHDDVLKGPAGEIQVSKSNLPDLRAFQIGTHEGVAQYVIPLAQALELGKGKFFLIDPRAKREEYAAIRMAVETAGFDPARLSFCVYGKWQSQLLLELFPESVLLDKIGGEFQDVTPEVLDRTVALGMHGIMLFRPVYSDDYSGFMADLKKRDLQVLFYVHGGWPKTERPDELGKSLLKMLASGVEYVTTVACDLPEFKSIVSLK